MYIMFRVICGLLKGKCVVLITHQLQFVRLADNILAIKNVNCFVCVLLARKVILVFPTLRGQVKLQGHERLRECCLR